MQLLVKRSQRTGGLLGGKVIFSLNVRAGYTPEEKASINKYNLGGEVIYNSEAARHHLDKAGQQIDGSAGGLVRGAFSLALSKMKLNITIASLQAGQHIECKDLGELIDAEQTIHDACVNVRKYLEVAATFDGREVLIDLDDQKPAAA